MHFGVAAANDFFGRCIYVIPWKFLLRRGQHSNSLAGLQAPQPLAGVVLFIERWSTTATSGDNSSCIYRIQAIAAWIRITEIRQAPAKRWDVLNSQGAVGLNSCSLVFGSGSRQKRSTQLDVTGTLTPGGLRITGLAPAQDAWMFSEAKPSTRKLDSSIFLSSWSTADSTSLPLIAMSLPIHCVSKQNL